jgi:hypothetical protein
MLVQHQKHIAKFLVKKILRLGSKVINLIHHQVTSQHSCCFHTVAVSQIVLFLSPLALDVYQWLTGRWVINSIF